ncbi:hypothetical protein A2803_00110 [Candidatus Woesebacteria bacterium RIFCSPHIGHO2_01_FULL_44_21]|uniref:Polysaccharide biosynthesis protein C-terminal domain-containing protein n=1 Tax=Candidatus Woesebacteria bacterium RIFCSPHIGHO2_01_FULL_44_21 TaxID=1802503 RepID=A0A1F7Z198_9BACT|nr:MAG: hypothetical protein A2803_00110 [Candidatus Woesebacteria bacterium RIFCSPHIGHO2_01_FULL_44_21]OGM71153.1 MAG: hypothetical protein A2897_02965 [Candidatus Woesebacteria bacterium RIFCSPLOWO2_01_FULL_44_24b]
MGYFRKTLWGVTWVGAFRALTRFIAFVRTIVLARILSPAQFGIFGIASLTITFLEILMETGINVVLVQKKKGINEYLNTAWVVSILRGCLISLILVVLAPFASSFFNSPESRNLVYLISLVSLIRGFINPAIVRFQKELRFGTEFWFRFVVFAVDSGVAVLVSLVTQSSVGIVWGLIAGALLELVMSFVFVSPRPSLEFNSVKLREILSKGKWVTGAGFFQFLFRQGDDGVVGRFLGETSLGIYQVAYKICSMPISEVTDVFGRVMFPTYVKLSIDSHRLRQVFIKITVVIVSVATLLGLTLFVFGEDLIKIFLGEQWLPAVPLVRVLSVFGVIQAVTNSMNSLLLALEKQKYITFVTLVSILGLGVTIVPLTLNYGLTGTVWAPLIGAIVGLPLEIWFVTRALKQKT